MKILGTIRTVCDPRTWWNNGTPVVIYPIIFDGEGGEFVGDMFASEETLKRRGIKNGAIGNMEIEFRVREAKRSTGDSYPAQVVRFKDFRLANAGIFLTMLLLQVAVMSRQPKNSRRLKNQKMTMLMPI